MSGDNQGVPPAEQFPRGSALPKQSPLYWVAEKDRYLRQLMIRDIQGITGRDLIVYFTDCETPDSSAQIHPTDDAYLAEVLKPSHGKPIDLMLETNGGYTDATEKVVALLRVCTPDLRVIVPRRAKSNGTLVALAAREIVMGAMSELGPIDPNIILGPQNQVPAQFVLNTPGVDPVIQQVAAYAVAQSRKLATTLLQTGMMASLPMEIDGVVNKLATRDHFHSHGSVIDADEAKALHLIVNKLDVTDDLWQRLWLLRCMYAHDLRAGGLIKIFEGANVSNALKATAPTP
jgi:hypothetical protein